MSIRKVSLGEVSSYKLPFFVAMVSVLSLVCSSSVAWAGQDAVQPASSATPRIVDKIDESHLVPIKGTVHPLANPRNDRGAAPESMQLDRMHLVLNRSASQETSLRQLINDMHTPGTASYHKWLTPDQFGKQFGPSDQDITAVETWLTGHGFSVTKVNPGRQTIEFSGNVAQMRSAFHTQIHKYEVNGESHYANAGDPQIPAALAPVVGGFVALNNFRVNSYAKALGKATYDPKTDKATPQWTTGGPGAYSFVLAPADYAVQYDLNPLYTAGTNGAGQTIAIINESNINIAMVNQFRSLFSLPANPPQVIIDGNDPGVDGINDPDGPNGASVEAYLDVEWSGAVAPGATVDLVIAADTEVESGLFLAAEHAVYGNIAPIMSVSFGNCESVLTTTNGFLNNLWEQAAAQGITVMVSTGDNGSAGCDNDNAQEYAYQGLGVNGFASTPFNVAVGGTDFYYSAYSQGLTALDNQFSTYWSLTASNTTPAVSIKGVIPEQPWNNSQYGLTATTLQNGSAPTSTSIAAGSGGASTIYTSKPAWQKGFGDGVRDIPDVSLFASNGVNASFYPICAVDGDCQPASSGGGVQIFGVGGTSASAPSFAGIMALVNQKYGRQGQADFVLYPLAAQFPAAFNDVKNGTNSVPCNIDASSAGAPISPDCIAVSNPVTVDDPNLGTATEGEIGTGTTPDYNAVAGYDLASGLGTIDANVLVTDWNKVTFASTTTTLTPSQTSFAHGTTITVSGAVTASGSTPTGDVSLVTASTEPGQQAQTVFTLTGGAYSGSVKGLPGGTYNIWGQYGGDSTNSPSSSTPVQVTVTPENSNLNFNIDSPTGTFSSSSTPGSSVDYGTQLLLSAQPIGTSGSTVATGTVAFTDGSTALNTAVLSAKGEAEYNAPFSVGAHSVAAKYSGDQSYNPSTASPIAFTVVKDSPVISLFASIQDGSGDVLNGAGQPTVFTVVIGNNAQLSAAGSNGVFPVPVAPPTGTVTVTGLPSGVPTTATLSPAVDPVLQGGTGAEVGVASFVIPAGNSSTSYTATVSYAGDGNYNAIPASSNTSFAIPVLGLSSTGLQASTTTATMSGSISPTTTISVTGTVTGVSGKAAPTGSVIIYSSGYYVGEVQLSAGSGDVANFSASLSSQLLSQGANLITLQYFGDTIYAPSAYNLNSGNPISNPLSDFTLIPESPIVAVDAPGDSATIPVNISSMNGFTGAVSLSVGPASTPGVKVQIPASTTLTANGSQTVNLQVTPVVALGSGTFDVELVGTDSTGKYVHTAGVQVVVEGNVAPTPGLLLSNSGNISVTAGVNSGNTSTITVTPLGGLTGAVNLTCAVTSPSGATDPATCGIATSVAIAGTVAQTTALTITTAADTTPGTYNAVVTAKAGAATDTTAVAVTVGAPAPPTFALSNSGNITVTPGATTANTSTITIKPSGTFSGMVSLSCTIAPTAATDPATCSIPASVSVSGVTTAALSIGTTAATSALSSPKNLFWPSAGGAALALVLFFGIPARKRNWPAMLGLLVLFVSIGALGCGGGGGNKGGGGGGGNSGTTAGTYTVTVTGTSGTITQTTAVTLTVQ
jgi:trimeric autotransporter adhesin